MKINRTDLPGRARELAAAIQKRYPKADEYPYRSWSYPQGYLLMGFIHLWEKTGDELYYQYVLAYCLDHVEEDGSVRGFTGCSMDDMMTGAVLVWMYEHTGEKRFETACRKIRETYRDYPRTREGGFLHNRTEFPGEMWVDGVFMGQMFLCRYGAVFGETECFDEAVLQLELIYRYCHVHDGLLVHAYSEDCLAPWAGPEGRSGCVWSEGLGWYALILTEVLDLLPAGYEGKRMVETQLNQLLAGLEKYQNRENGLWRQVVDRTDDVDNWCDTSGSAMFLYTWKWAADKGIVPVATAGAVLRKGYEGLLARIVPGEDGLPDVHTACQGLCVQKCYEDYIHYPKTVNAQEAVCGCLWALAAAIG